MSFRRRSTADAASRTASLVGCRPRAPQLGTPPNVTARSLRALLVVGLVTLSCRTGADGDPWAVAVRSDDTDDTRPVDDTEDTRPVATDDTRPVDDTEEDTGSEAEWGDVEGGPGPSPGPVAPAAPAGCTRSNEVCDGEDNDCNGEIDDGHVCPSDGSITGARPFDGGVYFVGTTSEGSAGATAIQRFWPTLHESYIGGFGSYDDDFVLRQSDWQLFYLDTSKLYGRVAGEVPIPDCSATMIAHYDFDASNTLYYRCPTGLFRGAGELVTRDGGRLLGVTEDGRVAVTRDGRFGHIGPDLQTHFSDLLVRGTLVFQSSRGVGDSVLAVFFRDVPEPEQVIIRFDEQSEWSVMRRIPTALKSPYAVALPDGTLFLESSDRIIGFMPDGTERVVWDEADAEDVRMHAGTGLFIGPLDPAEILH